DRNDQLGPRAVIARDVAREERDVRHELDLAGAGARAAHPTREIDAQTAHRALVGTDGERAVVDAAVEAAPVGLHERLPEQTRERGLDRDRVGLAGERGADERKSLVESRDAFARW